MHNATFWLLLCMDEFKIILCAFSYIILMEEISFDYKRKHCANRTVRVWLS